LVGEDAPPSQTAIREIRSRYEGRHGLRHRRDAGHLYLDETLHLMPPRAALRALTLKIVNDANDGRASRTP
jgi:hypothetical protein